MLKGGSVFLLQKINRRNEFMREKKIFTRKMIRNTRMIHLGKKVLSTEKNKMDRTDKSRLEKEFHAWGHYDFMTYTRFISKEVSFEHCFEIRYPYTEPEVKLAADQYFTLLDDSEELIVSRDPFEYDSNNEKECIPFVGMFLISLEAMEKNVEFENIVFEYIQGVNDLMKKYADDPEVKIIWKVFSTLNCADLCLIVRTDTLELFPEIRMVLKKREWQTGNRREAIITPMLFCEKMTSQNVEKFYSVFKKNKNIKLNIRVGLSENFSFEDQLKKLDAQIREDCLTAHGDPKTIQVEHVDMYIFDILGAGDYSVTLPLDIYFIIYSQICGCREQTLHEIGTGDFVLRPAAILISEWMDTKNVMLHERFRFPKELCNNAADQNIDKETFRIANDLIVQMEQKRKKFASERYRYPRYSHEFTEYISRIKDLFNTYNDLWYQSRYTVRGYIFYAQMTVMMEGIGEYLEKILDEKVPILLREQLMENILPNMHESIICINNYNKLLQNLHQKQMNFANYEIQTKVNAEKYFLAYTNFLMNICQHYFKEECEINKGVMPLYPVVTLDMTKDKIMTQMLFGKNLKESSGNVNSRQAFYSVIFPDYSRFANIFHVLPLLTHEISHCLRFQSREDRNRDFISYIMNRVCRKLADHVLVAVGEESNFSFLEPIGYMVSSSFSKYFEDDFKKDNRWKTLHLGELTEMLKDYFRKVCRSNNMNSLIGRRDGENEIIIWKLVKEELPYLNVDVKNFGELKNLLKDVSNDLSKLLRMEENFELQLIIEFFWNKEKPDETDREKFYSEIIRQLETMTRSAGEEHLLNTVKLLNNMVLNKNNLDMSKLIHSFVDIAYQKEAEDIIVKIYSLNDSMRRSEVGAFCDCLRKSEHEFRTILEEFKKSLYNQIKNKNKSFDEEKAELISADSIFLEQIDRRTRFQNFYRLAQTLDENKEGLDSGILSEIRKELRENMKRIYCSKDIQYSYLASKSGNRLVTRLGINSESDEYFKEQFRQAMEWGGERLSIEWIEDYRALYSEIYADLGMCALFGFDAFGYLRFAIHIYTEFQESRRKLGRDFEFSRFAIVAMLLLAEDDTIKNYDKRLKELWNKLGKYRGNIVNNFNQWFRKQTGSIVLGADADCNEILQKQEVIFGELKNKKNWESAFHYYLRHAITGNQMKIFYQEHLQPEAARLAEDKCIKDLHKIYCENIKKSSWVIEMQKKDQIIIEIGKHYNSQHIRTFCEDMNLELTDRAMTNEEKTQLQVDFVMENYHKYKDRFIMLSVTNLENKIPMEEWPEQLIKDSWN